MCFISKNLSFPCQAGGGRGGWGGYYADRRGGRNANASIAQQDPRKERLNAALELRTLHYGIENT